MEYKYSIYKSYNSGEFLYAYLCDYNVIRTTEEGHMQCKKVIVSSDFGISTKESYLKQSWLNLVGSQDEANVIISGYEYIGECRTSREAYGIIAMDDLLTN